MQFITYTLPAHWACALINDDRTGLEDDEETQLEDWLAWAKPGYCVGCSEEPEFCWDNDATTEGVNCLEFYFQEVAE